VKIADAFRQVPLHGLLFRFSGISLLRRRWQLAQSRAGRV